MNVDEETAQSVPKPLCLTLYYTHLSRFDTCPFSIFPVTPSSKPLSRKALKIFQNFSVVPLNTRSERTWSREDSSLSSACGRPEETFNELRRLKHRSQKSLVGRQNGFPDDLARPEQLESSSIIDHPRTHRFALLLVMDDTCACLLAAFVSWPHYCPT